jgi:two-component system, LytTR family, response regulator
MPEPQQPYRILIVDDEPLARQQLRFLLSRDTETVCIADCEHAFDAIEVLTREPTDIMFLDVQMPELNGFEMLERLALPTMPVIIFVTAFDDYAINAFTVHALDYLLKPVDEARFYEALSRAKEICRLKKSQEHLTRLEALLNEPRLPKQMVSESVYLNRFAVKNGWRTEFIDAGQVNWIEAQDDYVMLHTSAKAHLLRDTMNRLESVLDPSAFQRIHRSTIVNLRSVKDIQPHTYGDSLLTLTDGSQHRISRARRRHIETLLYGKARSRKK